MPLPKQIDTETLLRQSKPGMPGIFYLSKIEFVQHKSDEDYFDRCDNYTFTSVRLTKGTEYENEDMGMFRSPTSTTTLTEKEHGVGYKSVTRYESVIDCAPDFSIIYIEFKAISKDKLLYNIEDSSVPSSMWYARSFFQLLKNMREWQYAYENFDPNHPMAIYSNKAILALDPPEEILSEIDGWPPMHLGRFMAGDDEYKKIPHPYPEPSEQMKEWVVASAAKFKKQTIDEIIDKIKN